MIRQTYLPKATNLSSICTKLSIQAHFAYALTLKLTWVRDQYFPASYAHATWRRLAPFFQLAGTVVPAISTVQVELRPFNDRALNRDLAVLCERVNQASLRLPDGRLLAFTISPSRCILPAQEYRVT